MKNRDGDIAIQLSGVSKRYTIHHEKPTLVEKLVKRDETFWALKNINLTIRRGERIGIVGANGSGKTTLLKIIAGITTPTTGTVKTNGKIVSLIDLEAGFHPEFTGVQNIYLNCMLLGMQKDEIDSKLKKIISYAEIGKFIDAPLFTYSSGMKLRLGFSVALYADPSIMVLDEGLSVGDQKFKDKIKNKTPQIFDKSKTIIIVSHNLYTFFDYCRRIIVIDKNRISYDGGLEGIRYYDRNFVYNYVPPAAIKFQGNPYAKYQKNKSS